MRYVRVVPLLLAAVTFACTEEPVPSVTAPPELRLAKPVPPGTACNGTLEREIAAEIADLFERPVITNARAYWDVVTDNCLTDLTASREAMLAYVQFTIDRVKANEVVAPDTGTVEGAVLRHWNKTFTYVGYAAPGLPEAVFGSEGAIGVITQTTVNRELAAENAAITVPVQDSAGDQRSHLISIRPISPIDCLGDTNLDQYGPCFDFEAFPEVSPVFSPKVKVGICQPVDADDTLPLDRAALGHLLSANFVEIPDQESYPTFCSHLDDVVDAGSWRGGFGGITKRVAWLAKKAFGVQTLYAVHGGLGGLGGTMSPFGAVDRTVFYAPQGDEVAGAFPATPEIGTWTSEIQAPGSITVASSLGNYADTVIVLSQGGGACNRCGRLLLQGNLADSTTAQTGATYGVYEASWISVQASPSVKGAPFRLTDGAGRNIATLSYSTEKSVNILRYNGVNVGTWLRNSAQQFTIIVDLNTKKTSLLIDSVGVSAATNVAFQNGQASLKKITADFSGIDSGVMGWAKIFIRRLEDI